MTSVASRVSVPALCRSSAANCANPRSLNRQKRSLTPAHPTYPLWSNPNTVVAGVGGTGVLITSLIAMAAHIEGKGCATLNQTGLAQKFGAVVSHVRVAKAQADIKAVRIPAGRRTYS